MNTFSRSTLSIVCLAATLAFTANAQRMDERNDDRPEQRQGRFQDDAVTFESFSRSSSADSTTIDILYRFRQDFFVFARQPDSRNFAAAAEVSIEIMDSTENSITRHFEAFTITSSDNAIPVLHSRYWQGVATFHLPRGRYMALCTVADKESGQKQRLVRLPLTAPRARRSPSSSLLLAQSFDSASYVLPSNLGGDAFFGAGLSVVTELQQPDAPATATYALTRTLFDGEEHLPFQRDTTVRVITLQKTRLVPALDSSHAVVYRFAPDPLRSVAILPLHGETMPQGRYELTLHFTGADTSKLRSTFALRWIDMPQSLRDLDFATAAMLIITTEDEYDKLTSGRQASRIQAFEQFWKQRDPTPATAYNERLAEYFRRVDYAYHTFKTLKEDNGINTDRGKIHILYGSPASKDRHFSRENAPREVWRYPALKKVFTFEDTSRQGNYKLIQTDTQ